MEMLNDSTFEQEVLQAEGLVLVDFGATWCGPCKKLEPIVEDLYNNSFSDKMKLFKVDVGQAPGVAQKYRVLSVPQLIFFVGGEVKGQMIGLQAKDKIKEQIEALI